MPSRVIVSGIIIIIMIAIFAFILEFFLPLSMKSDMNALCRNALLEMETNGGLMENNRQQLQTGLEKTGFVNISISGSGIVRLGEPLNLHVEADYKFSRLSALFRRIDVIQHMCYDKTSMSRKVVN